ncbi:MAG: hypothetical protein ACE5J2_06220 [Nitrososphaerales archaeon]
MSFQKGKSRSVQFILSLFGGIIILVGGIVSLVWFFTGFPFEADFLPNSREAVGKFQSFQLNYAVVGISSGTAVITTSIMLKVSPQESRRWGMMIIALSAVSILGMGGFIFGMVLGIIGGTIAIIRSKSILRVEERKQTEVPKSMTETKMPEEKSMVYKCSSCGILFKSDEELMHHVIRIHAKQ